MIIVYGTVARALLARQRQATLAVVLTIQAMIVVDVSIVNVALPAIQDDLGVSQAELAWVLDGYLIAFGSFLLVAGRFGDLIGRRSTLLGGTALFVFASFLCGLAPNAELLVAARILQGLGGAFASAVVLAVIATQNPEPAERAKAMSLYIFISVGGGSLGLLLGGLLTEAISWHWIFFINVPIGLAAMLGGYVVLERGRPEGEQRHIDWAGAILVTLTAMVGVYTIIKAPDRGWTSGGTAATFAAAVVLAGLFLLRQRTAREPILPPHLLKIRSLSASSLVRGLFATGMFSSFFVGTLYFQRVEGMGTIASGAAFLPQTLMVAVLSIGVTNRLVTRFGAYRMLVIGLSLMGLGLLLFTQITPDGGYLPIPALATLVLGTGAGLCGAPLMAVAMSEVPAADAGVGSAIINLSMYVPSAIGLAVVGALTTQRTDSLRAAGQSASDALVGGYHLGYWIGAGCMAASLVAAATLLRPRRPEVVEELLEQPEVRVAVEA